MAVVEVPEWDSVRQAVQVVLAAQPDALDRLGRCPAIAIYTDGSAPLENPGGPAGSAAIVLGFARPADPSALRRPPVVVQLDIGAYIPPRALAPPTSSNRAEVAAILAALEVLRQRPAHVALAQQITIWSDSQYAVLCANGQWKQKKNTDLWALFNHLAQDARHVIPAGFTLVWTKGHVGIQYNEAADDLATRAAFNFDAARYQQLRAAQTATGPEVPPSAQAATGREVPPSVQAALDPAPARITVRAGPRAEAARLPAAAGVPVAPATAAAPVTPAVQSAAPARSTGWVTATDYAVVIYARPDNAGHYALFARDGRTQQLAAHHDSLFSPDEADYRTLIAALSDLLERIAASRRDPGAFSVTIYSRRELVIKQLMGVYKVHAPALRPLHAEAHGLLDRFKDVTLLWRRDDSITALLGR